MIQATDTAQCLILKSRFRYAEVRLLWARARLYRNRLVLTGLGPQGRYERTVSMADIESVRWRPSNGKSSYNVTLVLHDGERMQLWLSGAGLWKYAIEQCRGVTVKRHADDLPEELTPASAA